jgi:hypothetical protein
LLRFCQPVGVKAGDVYINTELTEPKLVLDCMAPHANTDTRTGLSASQLSGAKGMKVAG